MQQRMDLEPRLIALLRKHVLPYAGEGYFPVSRAEALDPAEALLCVCGDDGWFG